MKWCALGLTSQLWTPKPAVIPLASTSSPPQKFKVFSPPLFSRIVTHNCFFFKHLQERTMYPSLKRFWLGWLSNIVLLVTFIIIQKATKESRSQEFKSLNGSPLLSYSQTCMVTYKNIQLPKLVTIAPQNIFLSIKFSQMVLKHFA